MQTRSSSSPRRKNRLAPAGKARGKAASKKPAARSPITKAPAAAQAQAKTKTKAQAKTKSKTQTPEPGKSAGRGAKRKAAAPSSVSQTAPLETAEQLRRGLGRAFAELMMRRGISFANFTTQLGLSPVQARLLLRMDPERPSPSMMSEIAQEAGLEPSNLTGIVDKLEARGFVERRPSTDDRRVKMITLTEKGTEMRSRLLDAFSEPAPWMLALSESEQRGLRDLLVKGLSHESTTVPPDYQKLIR